MASLAKYGYLKASASIAKLTFRLSGSTPDPKPDRVIKIPSRDKGRTIKINVYDATNIDGEPGAVLVNFHGSGWVLPCHGESDHYCRTIARSTEYTVLDASYRLAPKTPFPGAQNDGEDVVRYVLSNPDLYDSSRIVISGFSAGGHTALVLATTVFPPNTFCKAILFYPTVDLSLDPSARTNPDPQIAPSISPKVYSLMLDCYVQDPRLDKKNPRLSPAFAPLDNLPNQMAIFTAGADNLMPEVDRYVARLQSDYQRNVTYRKFEGCNHAFDISPKPGSVEKKAQREAYSIVVNMLRS